MTWTTLQRSKLNRNISGWQGGSGPHLLMIHGVGMRADYWSNIIPNLVKHYRVTVLDMPGHGASPILGNSIPLLPHYTDSIARLIQDLTGPCLVVGHSMGAMIAVDLAARYPKSVVAFVAMNAVYQRSDSAKLAVCNRAARIAVETGLDSSSTLERWFGVRPVGVSKLASTACRRWLGEVNLDGYRQAYHAFADFDGPDESSLQQIACPGLFMTGSDEPNSTPAMSRAMATAIGEGRSYIVQGARHMMTMTHGDEVLYALLPFLLECTAGS